VTAFVIIGALGVTLVVVSLLFGDFLDGMFESTSFDVADGWLSTPVIGAFLAAFGFGGALLLRGLELSLLGAAAGGLLAGALLGGVTLTLVRALMNMPTDPTPKTGDLVGQLATVVTRIPDGGLGEIALTASGQRMKLSARSDAPIASGTTVVVVDVASPTSVVVTESGF
jgi:membrane protein implicated in regulation of membrane protease activity